MLHSTIVLFLESKQSKRMKKKHPEIVDITIENSPDVYWEFSSDDTIISLTENVLVTGRTEAAAAFHAKSFPVYLVVILFIFFFIPSFASIHQSTPLSYPICTHSAVQSITVVGRYCWLHSPSWHIIVWRNNK